MAACGHIGAEKISVSVPRSCKGRIAMQHLCCMCPGGFYLLSVYFFTGDGTEANNVVLLGELLKVVGVLSNPWVIGVDGYQSPSSFLRNGWLEKTRATIAAISTRRSIFRS